MEEFKISLRILGPAVDPKALSDQLGIQASHSFSRGDPYCRGELRRQYGLWCLHAEGDNASDFSSRLRELIRRVPADVGKGASDSETDVNVFVGLFGIRDQSSLIIESDVLAELGQRGWELIFDMYVQDSDNRE